MKSRVSHNSRFSIRTIVAVCASLLMVSGVLTACGEDGAGALFTTTCHNIGNRPENAPDLAPTEVIVLLDVANNDAATAARMAQDVGAVLDSTLTNNDDIVLTGMASGGTEGSMSNIECMQGDEYYFAGGNERRQEAERTDLKNLLVKELEAAVVATTVDDIGDARVLLRQVPVVAKHPQPLVILWSSFLSQGSDCLTFDQGDAPSGELAALVADRCATENLLPTLPADAQVTIVGAGSSPDRPELGSFGKSLATELCTRMAQNCDIR